jgi:TP901 family phage tail tape measure protein
MAAAGGMTQMGLGIVVNARDMASGPFRMMSRNFNGLVGGVGRGAAVMTGAFAVIAAGAASLAAGLGILREAFNLAEIAGQFEQTMVSVGAISRASAQELQQLEAAAVQAGIATQFSPQQAAEGLQSLAAAGQNAQNSIATLNPVLDLAAGSLGQLGVAQAAEAVVGTLNAYGMSADEAASVTDRLLRTTQMSNFQARDFQVGLSRAAAAGAQYGTELNDVLVTLGLMRNANIEASVSSTAFREATRRVMSDQQSLQALQRLGVRSYDEQTGASRSALDVMQDVAARTREMTDEERNATVTRIFGVRGVLAFNSVAQAQTEVMRDGVRMTLRGADAINHLRGNLQNAEGTAENFREQILSTFAGQMTLLQGTVETLQTVIGQVFAQIFRPMVLVLTNTLNAFIRVWTAIPEGARLIIAGIVLVGAAMFIFSGVIGIVVGTVVLLILVLGKLLLIMLAVAAAIAIMMLPVIAAMGVLAAAALLVYRAWQENLGGLRDWLEGWTNRISLVWRSLVALFSEGALSGELREEFMRAENAGIRDFVGQIVDFGHRVQEFWNGLTTGFRSVWKSMGPLWAEFRTALQQLFVEVGNLFGEGPGSIVTGVNALDPSNVNSMGQSFGTQLAQGLRLAVRALTAFIQAVSLVVRLVQMAMPFFRAVHRTNMAIASAFMAVVNAVRAAGAAIAAMWNRIPAPLRRIWMAGMTLGGSEIVRGVQGQLAPVAAQMAQERTGHAQQAELVAAQARQARKREQSRREEAATDRPAAAQERSRAEIRQELENSRGAAAREAGRQQRLQMNQQLNMSGERVAEIVTDIQERNGALEGNVTSHSG